MASVFKGDDWSEVVRSMTATTDRYNKCRHKISTAPKDVIGAPLYPSCMWGGICQCYLEEQYRESDGLDEWREAFL